MNYRRLFLLALLHVKLLIPIPFFYSPERITSFESIITVRKDASLEVKETISVISTGDQIKKGIFRAIPIKYGITRIPLSVKKIKRDGKLAKYDTAYHNGFIYIYVRDKEKLLPPGKYTFEITYETERQLGFFKNYNELAWNVTGAFSFPIDKVIAQIILPSDIPHDKIRLTAYTGYQGERGKNFQAYILENNICQFETTRPFKPKENITIVAIWPKGYINEPSDLTPRYLLSDYFELIFFLAAILMLLLFFIIVKFSLRDHYHHVIIPRFKAPEGMFPGKITFLTKHAYTNSAFTADIVNMAVLEMLKIEQGPSYRLLKEKPKHVPNEYKKAYATLFRTSNKLALRDINARVIENARNKIKEEAEKDYKNYINPRKGFVIAGTVLGILLAIIFYFLWGEQLTESILFIFTILSLFIFIIIPYYVFNKFFKTYTPEGNKLFDEIQGFKMFLNATEKDRLAMTSAPERTPQQYERFLPFAIALGVEKNWTKQFAPIFEQLKREGKPYQPNWYLGSNFQTIHLSRSFGTLFRSTLMKSSIRPGSFSS